MKITSAVDLKASVERPVLGGIESGRDAAQFILLGADTVQVCTGVMKAGYECVKPMCDELLGFMAGHKFETLADFKASYKVGRLLCYRVACMQSRQIVPNYEASMSKVYGTEFNQRVAAAGINLLGLYGGLQPGSKWARLHGQLEDMYLSTVSYTIAAGTSEIQRNVIATRGLGLPRG